MEISGQLHAPVALPPGKDPYMHTKMQQFFISWCRVHLPCNEEKGFLGGLFNLVPISSIFSSVSTYLLCVLLLSNTKHVGPLSSMCKMFCSIEEKHLTSFVWMYKGKFAVIVFTVYITQKHAMLQSKPRGNCRWRIDMSKPLREAFSAYNTTDLRRKCSCLLIQWHYCWKQEFYFIMAPNTV